MGGNIRGKLLIRAAQITHYFSYPYISRTVTERYYACAKKLMDRYQYDVVISSYAPMEAAVAGEKIKKNTDVFWVLYILDIFTNRGDSKLLNAKQNNS